MDEEQNVVSPESRFIHILVADDDPLMRKILSDLLQREEDFIVVAEAVTGREAIKLSGELKPQVILMDISMPEMNGIDATAHIHNNFPNAQVIGLSMHTDSATREAMLSAGAKAYLVKTDMVSALVHTIRDVNICGGS